MIRLPLPASLIAILTALALIAPAAHAALLDFEATLDGAQAGTTSSATGIASLQYDTVAQRLSVDLGVDGISLADLRNVGPNATPVHLHFAPPGSNGPIVFDLGFFAPFILDGSVIRSTLSSVLYTPTQGALTSPLSADQFASALSAGDLYLNIHTNTFGAGEIRGQVNASVPVASTALLIGVAGLGMARIRRRPLAAAQQRR